MPWGDGTGPLGTGPMTGRGLGFCSGSGRPGFFFGRCFGRGWGRGFGRGFRWQWFWRTSAPTTGQPAAEKDILNQQINYLEEELAALKKRLGEIENDTGA